MNRRSFLKALAGGAVALSAGGIALLEQEPIERTYFLPPRGGWSNAASWELVLAQSSLEILNEKLAAFDLFSDGRPKEFDATTPPAAIYSALARRARAAERVEKLLKGWVPPRRDIRILRDGTRVMVSGGLARPLRLSDLGPDALPWDPQRGRA